jgi:hypothetical protein
MASESPEAKHLIVVRGYPGSGRTTFAEGIGKQGVVLSIEDFYSDTSQSEDVFTSFEIARASAELMAEIDGAIKDGRSPIVVDTPAPRLWELRDILGKAAAAGYEFETVEPQNAWSRDPSECARKTHFPLKNSTWEWLVSIWEEISGPESIREAISPDERIRHAKWLISLGTQKGIPPEEMHRFLFDNYGAEIAELSRSGFIASPALHQAFLAKMRNEGETPPRIVELPVPDFAQTLDHLANQVSSSLPSASKPSVSSPDL